MDLTFYERLKLELSEEKPFFLNEMKRLKQFLKNSLTMRKQLELERY